MKKFSFLMGAVLCVFFSAATAQVPTDYFSKQIHIPSPNPNYSGAAGVLCTPITNGYAITTINTPMALDLLLLDKNGEEFYHRTYPKLDNKWIIYHPKDSTFIFSGDLKSPTTGLWAVYLMKTNFWGDTIWAHTYDTVPNAQLPQDMLELPDGSFMFGIIRTDFNIPATPMAMKVDANGNFLWIKSYEDYHDFGYTHPGGLMLTNDSTLTLGYEGYWRHDTLTFPNVVFTSGYGLLDIDMDGNVRKDTQYVWNNDAITQCICIKTLVRVGTSGKAFFSYKTRYSPSFYRAAGIHSVGDDYAYRWSNYPGPLSNPLNLNHLAPTDHGNVVACGVVNYIAPDGDNEERTWIAEIDTNGNFVWQRWILGDVLGVSPHPYLNPNLNCIEQTPDGGYILTGVWVWPDLKDDVWILKLDSMGCVQPGCDENSITISTENIIKTKDRPRLHVFPNPADQFIGVHTETGDSGNLEISDCLGKSMGIFPIYSNKTDIPTANLSAGLYFLRQTDRTGRAISVVKFSIQH